MEKQELKVRYKDLSIWLKIAIIGAWVSIISYGIYFLLGILIVLAGLE